MGEGTVIGLSFVSPAVSTLPSRLAVGFTKPSQCGDLGLGQERLVRGWGGEEYKERMQGRSYLTSTLLNWHTCFRWHSPVKAPRMFLRPTHAKGSSPRIPYSGGMHVLYLWVLQSLSKPLEIRCNASPSLSRHFSCKSSYVIPRKHPPQWPCYHRKEDNILNGSPGCRNSSQVRGLFFCVCWGHMDVLPSSPRNPVTWLNVAWGKATTFSPVFLLISSFLVPFSPISFWLGMCDQLKIAKHIFDTQGCGPLLRILHSGMWMWKESWLKFPGLSTRQEESSVNMFLPVLVLFKWIDVFSNQSQKSAFYLGVIFRILRCRNSEMTSENS